MILSYLESLTDMFPLRSVPLPFAQRHLNWYSEELKSEKREKRRLERRWRASRSIRNREA